MSRPSITNALPGPASATPRWRPRAVAAAALALPVAALAGATAASAAAGAASKPGYAVTATIHVGKEPFGVAVNPYTSRLYVTNENPGTVSVINTANNKVTATIGVGELAQGVAVDPFTRRVYVTNARYGRRRARGTPRNTAANSAAWPVRGVAGGCGSAMRSGCWPGLASCASP